MILGVSPLKLVELGNTLAQEEVSKATLHVPPPGTGGKQATAYRVTRGPC